MAYTKTDRKEAVADRIAAMTIKETIVWNMNEDDYYKMWNNEINAALEDI